MSTQQIDDLTAKYHQMMDRSRKESDSRNLQDISKSQQEQAAALQKAVKDLEHERIERAASDEKNFRRSTIISFVSAFLTFIATMAIEHGSELLEFARNLLR